MVQLKSFRRVRVRGILAAAAALGIGTVVTMAQFTDTGSATGTFSTGSLDISFDSPAQQGNPTPYVTALTLTNGKLGSTVVAPLQVNNSGSLPFSYTMATTADGDTTLSGALQVTIVSGAATCDNTAGLTGGTPVVTAVTGLTNVAIPARPLAVGSNEVLCFKVTLPDIAANNVPALMGKNTTATFAFTATQS
jgi:predicted ribosomally synthesized peptide with SipW-like signal peptide